MMDTDLNESSWAEAVQDVHESQPELLNLYSQISTTVSKLNIILDKSNQVQPILNKGLSILDVKLDTMLSYLIDTMYFVLKKCCGQTINDNEIRERVAHARVILEKIKPLEDKLKYQIEKMVRTTMAGQSNNPTDKEKFRANVADLESNDSEKDDEEEDQLDTNCKAPNEKQSLSAVYKPPKLASVPYTDGSNEEKQQKLLEQAKKRALNASVLKELKEEYLDTPLEIVTTNTLHNTHTKHKQERERYEETYFTRLPVTKKEKHRDNLMSSLTFGNLGNEITRFEDLSALDGRLPSKKTKKRSKTTKKLKGGRKKRRTM